MADYEQEKQRAAEVSVDFLEDGMVVGLGTGTTAVYFVHALGRKVQEGLRIRAIPSSEPTRELALKLGIPLTSFGEVQQVDVAVDGADEFDPQLNLIKGGGGALLREKIVASVSDRFVVICDSRKRVEVLGAFPLPVEVIPFGWEITALRIGCLGARVTLRRTAEGAPFVSEEGNYILDCGFSSIPEPAALGTMLDQTVGVVEHGLFVGLTDRVIMAHGEGVSIFERSLRKSKKFAAKQ